MNAFQKNNQNRIKLLKFKKIIFVFLILFFIFNINLVLAEESKNMGFHECIHQSKFLGLGGDICYEAEVAIPGLPKKFAIKSDTLGLYIQVLYNYLLYVAGVLAVIVIMIGGFQWIVAGGNQSKISEAKQRIISAIIGLFLALGSYLLLYTINPNLVEIHDLNMPSITPVTIDNFCIETQPVDYLGDPNKLGKDVPCGRTASTLDEYGKIISTCMGKFCDDGMSCQNLGNKNDPYYRCTNASPECINKKEWSSCTTNNGKIGFCDVNLQCSACVLYGDPCYDERQCLTEQNNIEKCGITRSGLYCKKIDRPYKTCGGRNSKQ